MTMPSKRRNSAKRRCSGLAGEKKPKLYARLVLEEREDNAEKVWLLLSWRCYVQV